jgi:hypothetical protein
MLSESLPRRQFLQRTALGVGSLAAGLAGCAKIPKVDLADRDPILPKPSPADLLDTGAPRPPYKGPNVILVRFGGGVRRLETVMEPDHTTWCPFVYRELAGKHGVLYPKVEITNNPKIDTSHGQGTLYLLTGQYDHYEDVNHAFLGDRFEARVPTLFEYLRRTYDIPEHQALLVNGEDRIGEEFYTFSNHHCFGVRYRSTVLSLYRFKTWMLWDELKRGNLSDKERLAKMKQLNEMERKDHRVDKPLHQIIEKEDYWATKEIDGFWDKWKNYYGKSGLVNPRGDRLLTELSIRAIRQLRPKFMMINYNDPDYVHWGPPSFYTQAISTIDDGVRQLWETVQNDAEYRDNTVFVIVPDCGRDNARATAVPFQHHFNSKSSREIFAVVAGPKNFVDYGRVVDKPRTQIRVTQTVGQLMGFQASHAQAGPLEEAFA